MQRIHLAFLLALTVLSVTLLAFVAPADAQIREVDCGGSTPYLDVNSALVGIAPGTTVLVHPCSYNSGFSIVGLNDIQVVAADVPAGMIGAYEVGLGTTPPAGPLFLEMSTSCVTIRESQRITIVGLDFEYCRNDGFTIVDSKEVLIDGNTVYKADGSGASVPNGFDIDLVGNHFRNAARYGVETTNGTAFLQITRNRLEGNNFGILMRGRYLKAVGNEIVKGEGTGIEVLSSFSHVSRNTVEEPFSGMPSIEYTIVTSATCVIGNDLFGVGVTTIPGNCVAENF